MHAVIMVAGKSTRTYPLTLTRPKPVLPVLNKPLIYYNLDQLHGLVDSVVFIVGYRKEMIEDLIGDEYRGMKIIYQEQTEQLGTGHAVLQAAPHVNDRFIVMNGDDLFSGEDIKKLVKFPYGALAMPVEDPSQFGIMEIDSNSFLVNFVEKPKEYISNLVNVGCYIMEPDIFDILSRTPKSERGEIELPGAILEASEKNPVKVIPLNGYWLPTGFPWDLLKTQEYLFSKWKDDGIEGKVEKGAIIEGHAKIEKNAIVKNGARIVGPAIIGRNSVVDSNAYIGPNTSIGNNVMIKSQSIIENTIILDQSIVDHASIVRHSVVGEGVKIGERSHLISSQSSEGSIKSLVKGKMIDTSLDQLGAILADHVVLDAETKILPGIKIWPGMTTKAVSFVEKDIIE